MSNLIVSLTTIPPRLSKIGPTLRDLLCQTANIQEIRLNIARHYKRFQFDPDDIPALPAGITLHMIEEDLGPATKVLPTLRDHIGKDVEILFCDDDQPYERIWAQRFLDHRQHKPNCCIVGKGYDLETRRSGHRYFVEHEWFPRAQIRKKGIGYRLLRTATLTMVKPRPYVADGCVDILEGYRGAMVRPEFFPPEVFDIPDILWTVDDPWLSGHLTRNNVPIWMMSESKVYPRPYSAHYRERLGAFVYKNHGRLAADAACIDYFRKTYGIWQGHKESPADLRPRLSERLGLKQNPGRSFDGVPTKEQRALVVEQLDSTEAKHPDHVARK